MSTLAQRRVIAAISTAALLGGTSLVAAAPASAADDPSYATAIGGQYQLDFSIGDHVFPIVTESSGEISVGANDSDYFSDADVTLASGIVSSITLDTVETAVLTDDTKSEAFATVEGTSYNLFGVSVLGLESAEAEVLCPAGETSLANVDASGFTIFGIPVTFNEDGSVDEPAPVTLGSSVPVSDDPSENLDLSDIELGVSVGQVTATGPDGALGISIVAVVSLSGTFEGETVATTAATLILAGAACGTPLAPLTATAITPASGPTAGGNTVTITGTGFTPETTVTFGTAPATAVVAAVDGNSLTATVPAGTAGATTVTIDRPEYSPVDRVAPASVTLSYTYVAPTVPVIPIVPAGTSGTAVLAATGLDPMPLAAGSAGVLGLGLLALIATAIIRRRSA